MNQHPNTYYFAPSVDLAARILGMLSRYRTNTSTLTEISTALDASKATCLRVLRTLEAHELIAFDPDTRRYSLGIYAVILGSRAEEHIDYLSHLRPALQEASARTGMTAVLVQRVSADRMMYVARQESDSRARVNVSVGNRFPITDVSYGKWLLAYTSAEDRAEILARGLRRVTPRTVTDRETYLAQLDRIRAEGVLVSREEYVPGVCAVSCPVFDRRGGFLGVLAVLGLAAALDDGDLEAVAGVIRGIGMGGRCASLSPR